jgi:hypothetical protein
MAKYIGLTAMLAVSSKAAGLYDANDGLYGFECFGGEKAEIKFQNQPEVSVPDLSPVRVLQHAYESGWAANYVAYMFLREKLGIDTSFYPGIDHSKTYSEYYTSPGPGPEEWMPGYPGNFWFYLANDTGDMNFEYWANQEVAGNGAAYYADGSVIDGGFSGFYGEISFWVPKYFVEEYPTVLIPNAIATDPILRELLINGSRNGDTDWIAYYSAAGRTTHSVSNYTTQFDEPDGSKPIVWASLESYSQTVYANQLANNSGLDIHVVSTSRQDEFQVKDIAVNLYNQRLPFIANIYVPDVTFGQIDPLTGKTFEFEKISFPRNPNQSPYDPCYADEQTCQYPIIALKKSANPRLTERFPEAYTFFQKYKLQPTEITSVMTYFSVAYDTMSENATSHDHWMNASCEWMKANEPVWTNWLVDIKRWNCLPGCGIEHEGNYIGGTCDYATPRSTGASDDMGTCECVYEFLKGDNCDLSCPGLSAPYFNGSVNTFDVCSAHGTCDIDTLSCTCTRGYGGNGCNIKYDTYKYPVIAAAAFIVLSSLLIIVTICCIVWLRFNAQFKTVKALSIEMTTLFSIGLLCLLSSNIALVVDVNDASCIAWQWLFGLGGILAILSPLLKAYRVSRVFHGGKMLRAVKITDKMLMQTLIKAASLEVFICLGYTVAHQAFGGSIKNYNDTELQVEYKCNDNSITGYIALGSYAYFSVMLCALTYYSYGTRRALSVFKESTCAYSSSAVAMFCSLITFGFFAATDDITFKNTVQAMGILIVTTFVLSFFYGTRIYTFYKEPENRNVTDARAPTYTASSTTGVVTAPTGATV